MTNISRRIIRKLKGWNTKLDKVAVGVSDQELEALLGRKTIAFDRSTDDFQRWIEDANLKEFQKYSYPHKKALEFFFSASILDIKANDVVLDAAGGKSNYLSAIKNTYNPARLVLTDHIYPETTQEGDVLIAGGDISQIDLGDASIDKISCHHAFEHFQEDKDVKFIKEIARLIKLDGKAVIIPLFVSKSYVECWNIEHNGRFDEDAQLLVDKTASLPGSDNDGHFARVYDHASLRKRILSAAEEAGLNWTIYTCALNGSACPDMKYNAGAQINYPLRALTLEKAQ